MAIVPVTLNYVISKGMKLAYALETTIFFESYQPGLVGLTSRMKLY